MNNSKNHRARRDGCPRHWTLSLFLLVLLSMTATAGCTAGTVRGTRFADDSVAVKALGDSVYAILTEGKIKSARLYMEGDTLKTSPLKKLTREESYLFRFLLTDPDLYVETVPVYGLFSPRMRFRIQSGKRSFVDVNLDNGLKRWNVTDSQGKELYRSSLATDALWRFCLNLYKDELTTNHKTPEK